MNITYDAVGTRMSVTYNDVVCYYVTNIQGDILAILNTSGTTVVQYTYDAWGNILTTTGAMADTLGEANPLRYRSYVYDQETGLYYLQSRYYDPQMCRFINADAYTSTGQGLLGNNMFAYCRNNPVRRIDSSGHGDIEVEAVNESDEVNSAPNDSECGSGYGAPSGNSGTNSPQPSNASTNSASSAPQHAWDTLNYVNSHNGNPPPGYKGGNPYGNDGRNETQVLPEDPPYREYDVHPYTPGVNRGKERIVIGGSGAAWYTNDHYHHFVSMEECL